MTGADLEVDPEGENLTFELLHTGNAYERPYFAKAGAGWNITLPDDAEDVAPYASTTFLVHVQPPSDAVAGEVGVLRIRITGNDTSGLVVEEIPVRVGASPNIVIDHRGTWNVNALGGYPTSWIENQGNDIAMLTVDVDGLPDGWSTNQGTQVILAPGEVAGLPLSLVPSTAWNQQRFLLTVNINHPLLGILSHNIEVEYSPVVFTQSPVFDGFVGTEQSVGFAVEHDGAVTFDGGLATSASANLLTFEQPAITGEHLISYSTENETGNLSLYAVARPYPSSVVSCEFLPNVFDTLGRIVLEGPVATCSMEASEDEPLKAVITLVTTSGERVNLEQDVYDVAA